MNPLVLGALALVVTACAGEPRQEVDDTLVVSDDPELAAMAAEMLPDLAARSGLGLRGPVRIERRSREELETFLRAQIDEELPPLRAARLARAYHLLGMAPADLDLRALLMSVYLEQVAGFYDPDSAALFVLDDQSAETLEPLLLHELVHAVQDQWADLDSLTAQEQGNDRRVAAQAAIEGHATLVMLEYMTERMRGGAVDLSEVPDMADQLRPALATVAEQYPALASAPAVIQQGLLFPYLEGAGYVLRLWQSSPERHAPFADWLPLSTEQVSDPSKRLGAEPDPPTRVRVAVEGLTPVLDDVLGQLETGIMLEELGGVAGDAQGWDGDRWVLFDDGEGTGGLVWASVWDDPQDRDRHRDALAPRLEGLPGAAALSAVEVDGRPVLVLTVGLEAPVRVTLEGGS